MKAGITLLTLGTACFAGMFLIDDSLADKILMFGAGWNLALGYSIIVIQKMGLL